MLKIKKEKILFKTFKIKYFNEIKEMINNISYVNKEFKCNIDLNYNLKFGGDVKGEMNYYFKDINGYNFIYAIEVNSIIR